MKFLFKGKDGGPESKVYGYWFVEGKKSFSVALLRFEDGSREAYHSHAFNSVSLVLGPGWLKEEILNGPRIHYRAGTFVRTFRETFHKVTSIGRTWVLTVRGPWSETWQEQTTGKVYTLKQGRKRVSKEN